MTARADRHLTWRQAITLLWHIEVRRHHNRIRYDESTGEVYCTCGRWSA